MPAETLDRDSTALAVTFQAPSGVVLYGFSVCVHTMRLHTWICELTHMLQRSTSPRQELFWTGTALQECSVWSRFRKDLFSVPLFQKVSFIIIRAAYHLCFATGIGCDELQERIDTFYAIYVFSLWYFRQKRKTSSINQLFFFFPLSFNSRLHSNNLNCDCHLAWLAQWLRQRPTIGLFTQCTAPPELRGLNVAEVQKHEFSCSGKIHLQ